MSPAVLDRLQDVAPPGLASSAQACETAGITYRQLDYWIRRGVLGGDRTAELMRGSGSARRFTRCEVDRLQVLGRLSGLLESLTGEKTDVLAEAATRIAEAQDAFGRTPASWWLVMTGSESHVVPTLEAADELVADDAGAIIVSLSFDP